MQRHDTEDSAIAQLALRRRALLIGAGQAAVLLAIAGRLRFLQVTESEPLRDLAERNRINITMLEPLRGRVFARDGTVLANNILNYRILMVREQAGDVEQVLRRLSVIVPLTEAEIRQKIEQVYTHREFVPVLVAENVSWEQVAAVAANAPALPGISTQFGSRRFYPFGPEFAHIVGYVGPVDSAERDSLRDPDPLLFLPDYQIGKTGLEKGMDRQLRGSAGNRRIEVNVQGRELRELARVDANPGADMQISIDPKLQSYASARIGANVAAAVVMNVRSGQILASTSTPAFDPNKFVSGHTVEEFELLLESPGSPLINRPMRGLYPPGSTFKMVTAIAALEAGVTTEEEEIHCDGRHELQNRNFHCWRREGHNEVDLLKSISESCDIYYYVVAERVGIEAINRTARQLGFGVRHDLPFPEVASGQLPTRSWKLENRGQQWLVGDTLNAGIGQGFVLASAMQLAVMTARLATSRQVQPRLLISNSGNPVRPQEWQPVEISQDTLDLIRRGLIAAVNDENATAYDSRSIDPSFLIAGKTGTSQVRTITEAQRRRGLPAYEDLPVRLRDHALFCGYAPYDNPEFAAAVIVEHGGSGSSVAAPIVRDLLMYANYRQIPPLEAYPPELRPRIREEQRQLRLEDSAPSLERPPGVSQA